MKRWNVITTVDIERTNEEGNSYIIPAGSVINTCLWDGVTPWEPPQNTIVEQVEE